eukprot:9033974-Pyramimonas_sp.AAC.1
MSETNYFPVIAGLLAAGTARQGHVRRCAPTRAPPLRRYALRKASFSREEAPTGKGHDLAEVVTEGEVAYIEEQAPLPPLPGSVDYIRALQEKNNLLRASGELDEVRDPLDPLWTPSANLPVHENYPKPTPNLCTPLTRLAIWNNHRT